MYPLPRYPPYIPLRTLCLIGGMICCSKILGKILVKKGPTLFLKKFSGPIFGQNIWTYGIYLVPLYYEAIFAHFSYAG